MFKKLNYSNVFSINSWLMLSVLFCWTQTPAHADLVLAERFDDSITAGDAINTSGQRLAQTLEIFSGDPPNAISGRFGRLDVRLGSLTGGTYTLQLYEEVGPGPSDITLGGH